MPHEDPPIGTAPGPGRPDTDGSGSLQPVLRRADPAEPGGHRPDPHRAGPPRPGSPRPGPPRSEPHRSEPHRSEPHRSEPHRSESYRPAPRQGFAATELDCPDELRQPVRTAPYAVSIDPLSA